MYFRETGDIGPVIVECAHESALTFYIPECSHLPTSCKRLHPQFMFGSIGCVAYRGRRNMIKVVHMPFGGSFSRRSMCSWCTVSSNSLGARSSFGRNDCNLGILATLLIKRITLAAAGLDRPRQLPIWSTRRLPRQASIQQFPKQGGIFPL